MHFVHASSYEVCSIVSPQLLRCEREYRTSDTNPSSHLEIFQPLLKKARRYVKSIYHSLDAANDDIFQNMRTVGIQCRGYNSHLATIISES